MVITFELSPVPRCNLHHRILHQQVNPLLSTFCLPDLSYSQAEGKNVTKKTDIKLFVKRKVN